MGLSGRVRDDNYCTTVFGWDFKKERHLIYLVLERPLSNMKMRLIIKKKKKM
jgi:hypothetical protein